MVDEKLENIISYLIQTIGDSNISREIVRNILELNDSYTKEYMVNNYHLIGTYQNKKGQVKLSFMGNKNDFKYEKIIDNSARTILFRKINNFDYIIGTSTSLITKNKNNEQIIQKTINKITTSYYKNDKIIASHNAKQEDVAEYSCDYLVTTSHHDFHKNKYQIASGDTISFEIVDGQTKAYIISKSLNEIVKEQIDVEIAHDLLTKDAFEIVNSDFYQHKFY